MFAVFKQTKTNFMKTLSKNELLNCIHEEIDYAMSENDYAKLSVLYGLLATDSVEAMAKYVNDNFVL